MSFCIIDILNCASTWFTAIQFAIGMAGPNVRTGLICKVDYVTVYYLEGRSCPDEEYECQYSVDVIHCDLPIPEEWFVACSYRDEFVQDYLCSELFDFDRDSDVDLFDFAEFQNEWAVEP